MAGPLPIQSARRSVPSHNGTGEPRGTRWLLIGVAGLFLAVFLLLPLANVFAQALGKGLGAYLASLRHLVLSLSLLLSFGCATKDYVKQQIDPLIDRISRLEARVSAVETKVNALEGKVAEIDAIKRDVQAAKSLADDAMKTAKECCNKADAAMKKPEDAAKRAEAAAAKAEAAAEAAQNAAKKCEKSFELQQMK